MGGYDSCPCEDVIAAPPCLLIYHHMIDSSISIFLYYTVGRIHTPPQIIISSFIGVVF